MRTCKHSCVTLRFLRFAANLNTFRDTFSAVKSLLLLKLKLRNEPRFPKFQFGPRRVFETKTAEDLRNKICAAER